MSRAEEKIEPFPFKPSYMEAAGLLLVNDLHASPEKIGRRKDDYTTAVLNKLRWIVRYANTHRLILLGTGDVFDAPQNADNNLTYNIQQILSECWTNQGIIIPGNHDMSGTVLSNADSLAVVGSSGLIRIPRSSGPYDVFVINGCKVGVGGTPYGQRVPNDVTSMFPEDVEGVVWLTHHDWAFGTHPESMPFHEIKGCGLVYNGHIHLPYEPVQVGQTVFCNFGTIGRTSVDQMEHHPIVTVFNADTMLPVQVPHERDVFNLTGRLVKAIEEEEQFVMPDGPSFMERFSSFADDAQTSNGVMIVEELEERRQDGRLTARSYGYLNSLLNEVVAAEKKAA